MVYLTIFIFRYLGYEGEIGWSGICSFIADSHTGLVYEVAIYTLFAHCILYKEGMAALLSTHLLPIITVNVCVHSVE